MPNLPRRYARCIAIVLYSLAIFMGVSPGLASWFVENVRGNTSGNKLAVIQVAEELAVFHHHLASQNSSHRPPANVPAFPDAVVTQVQVVQG